MPLTNTGGANATAISAVLTSSTPGVTIGPATPPIPDLAAGASGNNMTPYSFPVTAARPLRRPDRSSP